VSFIPGSQPGYTGLSEYQRHQGADVKWQQRQAESDEAYRRRVGPYLQYLQQPEDDEKQAAEERAAWAAQRALMGSSATGTGLFGHATPQDRGAAMGSPGAAFGGEQQVAKNGGLNTAIAGRTIGRVYAADLEKQEGIQVRPGPASVLRSSGEGWL
jgi:hypothetical protein